MQPLSDAMPHNTSFLHVYLLKESERFTYLPLEASGTEGGILCRRGRVAQNSSVLPPLIRLGLLKAKHKPSTGHQPPRLVRRPVGLVSLPVTDLANAIDLRYFT